MTGALILSDAFSGDQLWGELFEVPLMSAMFLAMVWHARRRQDALAIVERSGRASAHPCCNGRSVSSTTRRTSCARRSRSRAAISRFISARTATRLRKSTSPLTSSQRIEQILERLLLLAKADQPDFVVAEEVDLEPFLEDVFMRWAEVAPRAWKLGPLAAGSSRSTRKACALRSTRCSRTRSSTRSAATRSS